MSILDAEIDKNKPLTDEQYKEVEQLSDTDKRTFMSGFCNVGWSQKDIERHYSAKHFPVVKYYSTNGGGKGTISPPKSK